MKKIIAGIIISSLVLVGSTYAAIGDPGSKNDPLVTKSYVDQKIAELGSGSGAGNSALAAQVEAQQQVLDILIQQVNGGGNQGSMIFEVVTVPAGKSLIGNESSELILRSGKASVIGSAGGGIQDITDGVDLNDSTNVPKYHLVITPRADGRGMLAETEIIVMVRGGYTIK